MITDKSSIVDKAYFLSLSFGKLGNSRSVGKEILATDADKNYLNVQKKLLDSPELKAIEKADGHIKSTIVNYYALPFDMPSVYLIPKPNAEKVTTILDEYQTVDRPALVKTFLDAYPTRIEDAAKSLGTQFVASQYFSSTEVASKFYFDYNFFTFEVPEGLKHTKEVDKNAAKIAQAADNITLLMRQNLLELIAHLKDRLEPSADGKAKKLHESAVVNIQDFLEKFKVMNITGDAELEKLVEQTGLLLHPGFDVDVLKKDEIFKESVKDGLTKLKDAATLLVEDVPSRKFKGLL